MLSISHERAGETPAMASPKVLPPVIRVLKGGAASAGGIDKLVALLSSPSGKAREAAAMALYHMCIASPEFCSDTFTSLCNAMLHARGEAAVLAALEPIYSAGGAEGLAATYLTNASASITPAMMPITNNSTMRLCEDIKAAVFVPADCCKF